MILPEKRRQRLTQLLSDGFVRTLEAHNGLSASIAEHLNIEGREFDAIWLSSLTESASRGKPDNEFLNISPPDFLVYERKHENYGSATPPKITTFFTNLADSSRIPLF